MVGSGGQGAFAAMRARGDEFWWYVCCEPRAPFPTEFIDQCGCALRTWLWMTWAKGMTGILVWETSHWTPHRQIPPYDDPTRPQNPYADPMAWNSTGGMWGNGDGRFVYPPLKAVASPIEKGQPPILDAPNPCYRLAMLRDGLEDYEYFVLLRKLDPDNALLKVPEGVFRKTWDFSTDPSCLHDHRLRLAREIVRLRKARPGN